MPPALTTTASGQSARALTPVLAIPSSSRRVMQISSWSRSAHRNPWLQLGSGEARALRRGLVASDAAGRALRYAAPLLVDGQEACRVGADHACELRLRHAHIPELLEEVLQPFRGPGHHGRP